jgi:ribulose-5-phosphate 4-epimerase/fuculose-1-phosphate aldolase
MMASSSRAKRGDTTMKFAIVKNGSSPLRDTIARELVEVCLRHGHEISIPMNGIQFVLNLTDTTTPKSFRRRSQSVFVVSIVENQDGGECLKSRCYSTLVRSLSNLLVCAVPANASSNGSGGLPEVHFTTPEAGFYHLPFDAEEVYQRILPIIGAHFSTDNVLSTDLPDQYWNSSPIVEEVKHYGRELQNLKVLPTPFPLRDVLSEEDMRHIYKIYGITGASYGNLSARESIPELGQVTFWMTGRGVNKANLSRVGKDILLVKGFDEERGAALVSMPPGYDPKARVSVDAIEHYLVYRQFPDVRAIIHVHAWIDDVLCTRQNYPCGTRELAHEVVGLLSRTVDPSRAEVGLKNHGLTITGHSLEDIFDRVGHRLRTEVHMFA